MSLTNFFSTRLDSDFEPLDADGPTDNHEVRFSKFHFACLVLSVLQGKTPFS